MSLSISSSVIPSAESSSFISSVRSRNGTTATDLSAALAEDELGLFVRKTIAPPANASAMTTPAAITAAAPRLGAAAATCVAGAVVPGAEIDPWHNRRYQTIPSSLNGRDVRGLFGVVSKSPSERRDRLVDGVGRDGDARPHIVEQLLDADDFAGPLGEV